MALAVAVPAFAITGGLFDGTSKTCTGQSVSYRLDTPAARAFLASFVAVP